MSSKNDTMTSNNNLPAEIISEIASYDPRFKAKLENLFTENQKIIKHNKDVYSRLEYIHQRRNDLASMMMMPGYIDKEEYKEVMEDFDNYEEKMLKERKYINCKRKSKDMSKKRIYYTFYTENICDECATKYFTVKKSKDNKKAK